MTLLNENPHSCVAFRNLYIESRYLINLFLKFCIYMVVFLLWGVGVNKNYYHRFVFVKQHYGKSKEYFTLRKMQVPFSNSIPIGNAELRWECSPEHLIVATINTWFDAVQIFAALTVCIVVAVCAVRICTFWCLCIWTSSDGTVHHQYE